MKVAKQDLQKLEQEDEAKEVDLKEAEREEYYKILTEVKEKTHTQQKSIA